MASNIVAGSVVIEITGDNAQLLKALNNTVNSTRNLDKQFQNFFMTTAAIRTTLSGFSTPLQEVFNVFSKFDFGMSKVQAITAATNVEISNLREQAKLLGKTTFFTASQVADAQKFLAMAGFNPDQILKATPNVLNLALAGDMDLGMAADIATNISTPFKIAAEDLGRVNDILAKANTSSNTNVTELGQAFKYAAPVAAAAGQEIEEVGAALAILANNGIKADTAGTSVRMMLVKLANVDVQDKFKELGIDVKDSTGKIRPLMDILQDLNRAMEKLGMGKADQMAKYFEIFEQRAGTSAVVLGRCGDAATDFRMKMLNAGGTADEMARVMADNMRGDYIAFMSAVEGIQIAFGEAITGQSRSLLQLGTSFVRYVTECVSGAKELVQALFWIGSAGVALISVVSIIAGISHALKLFKSAAMSLIPSQAAVTRATINDTAATTINTESKAANASGNAADSAAININTESYENNSYLNSVNTAVTDQNTVAKETNTAGLAGNTAATGTNTTAKYTNATGTVADTTATTAHTTVIDVDTAAIIAHNAAIAATAKTRKTKAAATTIDSTATAANTAGENGNAEATLAATTATTAKTRAKRAKTAATVADTGATVGNNAAVSTNTQLVMSNVIADRFLSMALDMLVRSYISLTSAIIQNSLAQQANLLTTQSTALAIARQNPLIGQNTILRLSNSAATNLLNYSCASSIPLLTGVGTAATGSAAAHITATGATTAHAFSLVGLGRAAMGAYAAMVAMPGLFLGIGVAAVALGYQLLKIAEGTAEINDQMEKNLAENDKLRDADQRRITMLGQIAQKQELSNAEYEAAKSIITELQSRYGDLGFTFDDTGKSITASTNSMEMFNDAARKNALKDLNNSLIEAENNVKNLGVQMDNTSYYWREVGGYLTFGFLDNHEEAYTKLQQKQEEERKKIEELQKKKTMLENGANAIDVAKGGNDAILDSALNDENDKEKQRLLEDAERNFQQIYQQMQKEGKSKLENEIDELEERNKKYHEYLDLLIKTAKAKGEEAKVAEYQALKDEGDKHTQERKDAIIDAATNNQLSDDDLLLQEKQQALGDALVSGDRAKIDEKKRELDELKQQIKDTSYLTLRDESARARTDYETKLSNFNSLLEDSPERAKAAAELEEARKKYEDINGKFVAANDDKYKDFESNLETTTKEAKQDLMAESGNAGTFSLFEMDSVKGNTIEDILKSQRLLQINGNMFLQRIADGVEEGVQFA